MEAYLDQAFNLDSYGSLDTTGSHQQHQGSMDASDGALSPLTLSRLQASWNSSQNHVNEGTSRHQDNDTTSSNSSPTDNSLGGLTGEFDPDLHFFSSTSPSQPASTAEMQESYILGRNSLGLLDNNLLRLSPQGGATAMSHSQSASSVLESVPHGLPQSHEHSDTAHSHAGPGFFGVDATDASPAGKQLQRSSSTASPSFINSRHGSIGNSLHQTGIQHPSRHDFSIGQSPKSAFAMPGHTIPITPHRGSAPSQQQSPFDPHSHDSLLSLSQTQVGSMGPPAFRGPAVNLAKRGYLSGGSEYKEGAGQEGEPTPLASSVSTFSGQHHTMGQIPSNPSTPFNARQGMLAATPGSSFSNTTTPDDIAHGWINSPYTPASMPTPDRPGMQRMHSVDGSMQGHRFSTGMQTFSQPLDTFWSGEEDDKNAMQNRNGLGLSNGAGLNGVNGGLSIFHRRTQQNAMTRVTSAPSLTPLQISTGAVHSSVPSTPSDCPPGSAVSWASSIPSTPGDVTFNLSPGFGAAGMVHSRSMGGMPNNMSPPINVSGLSLHEASPYGTPARGSFSGELATSPVQNKTTSKGRSNSKSSSSTPRKPGGRASGQLPPLVVSSADKVHVCHCGKRFKRMEHLKRHNRTHTQERPHKCPVEGCGKFFGRTDNLSQHLKTHYRSTGLARASQQLYAMSNTQGEQVDLRHDPHAAAAQAAAAAMQAVSGKRRSSTVSGTAPDVSDILGGPISLTRQGPSNQLDRNVLMTSASANASPTGGAPGGHSLSPAFAM